jgi:PAS domain S-box-containing protein
MEQAVRASHREFEAVANLVPDLLWSTGAAGEPTWYNQRWLDYTGLTEDQSRGSGWTAAIHPDDLPALRDDLQNALASGSTHRHESRIRRHDGVYRWFLGRAEPVRDESGQITRWMGAATDIDEQRVELDVARDELRALAARLMTMQEDEQRRIARDLHDSIGQQLAAAQSEISHARRVGDPVATEQVLAESERRLAALSQEAREMSHRLHPSVLEDLGLPAALRGIAAEFERAHAIPVDTRIGDAITSLPLDTSTVIYRIAQEALRNTAKHAGTGARVTMTLSEANGAVRFTVEDNGPGFDLQAERTRGGLGLVSMRERARLAGGTLGIETALGEGTKVVLTIPIRNGRSNSKPTALIADDSTTIRYILRRFAEAECEVVAEASNGMEAVEAAERFQPDLAILDVSMPGMGGIEAARCLRERLPKVRIIFASQHTAREYVEEAFRAGGHGYIVKQAAPVEVGEAIREVLAGRQFRSPATHGREGR